MEKYETIDTMDRQQRGTLRFFTGWVLIAQVLGLISVVMVAVWMGHFRGGFAWSEDPDREFNYHPLFMIIGMVFLYGNSILVYRVFRNNRKTYVKVLHASLHMLALIFAAVGLKAVFDSHNLASPPRPNLYSLHSWLGLGTVILFGLQWVFGFLAFLKPGLSMEMRRRIKPTHVFVGLAIFFTAIATALTGIMEKTYFSIGAIYGQRGAEATLINCLAVTLVLLGVAVGYIVTNPNYQRQPEPEEERLQLAN